MADMIKFYKGLEASLPASGVNGALYITTDEGAIYLGTGTGMKRLGDFVQVANVASLPAKAHESCLYYCVAENILAKWNGAEWKQINKQPTAEELKTLLGLGSMAYKSEVAEGDLNETLAKKINDASAANHGHENKDVIDGITADKVTAWDSAEQNAKNHADSLNTAMNTRVEALEAIDHEHANKDLLDTYTQTEENLADAVAKKHEHTNKDVLDGITAEKVTAWDSAESNAKSYADGLATGIKNDIIGEIADGKTVVDIVGEAVYDDTQVKADIKANADAIATINNADTGILKQAKDYADGKDEAIAAAKKAGEDAQKTINDYKTANDKALADEVTARENGDKAINDKIGEVAEGSTVVGMINKVAGDLSTHATEAGNTYETKTDASAKLAEAKKYTDDKIAEIPAQTDYTVTITENTEDTTVAKTYVFTQCGAEIGSIKLAKELVVTSGSVKEVETADAPYAGAKVGEKYIELVIANQDAPIYVPAKDLVDIYTAKDGAAEVQVAISNTNEISATLVNGGVTEEKLAEGVKTKLNKVWEEVGVAQDLVDGLANGQVKTNKEAIEAINNETTGILAQAKADATSKANTAEQNAKDYADGLAGNYAEAEHEHVVADITDFDTKVKEYGYATTGEVATAKSEAISAAETKAGELDAALKTEIIGTAEDASTADTIYGAKKYAEAKVIALAGNTYSKEETFTKDEVNAAIEAAVSQATEWGSF